MRGLAERPAPWRVLGAALALGTCTLALTCGRHEGQAPVARVKPGERMSWIHIKYRAGHVRMAAIEGARPELLFASMHRPEHRVAAYDDARVRWVRVEVPSSRVQAVLARLQRDRDVEEAFVPPTVALPSEAFGSTDFASLCEAAGDGCAGGLLGPSEPSESSGLNGLNGLAGLSDDPSCPIKTPSFESYQGYLGPAPGGIDAPAVWRYGARGQGVWFADIEGAWNAAHEDLPGDRVTHVGGQVIDGPYWRMHGTAVLGEVVGIDNGRGVVGIAPDVDRVLTSSIGGVSPADAIDTAAEKLRAGDVLLIELQGGGPRGRYLPMEYWDDCYDAIAAATERGVIVIEAAGNGAENLDHRAYGGKLERRTRDSGAIMIGAGGPPRAGFADRERLDFSNYGSRVDVQGWGRMVATLDYGDLQACAGADRHYTGEFAGTSSASPIVAGAAILLQSLAKSRGRVLTPAEVRDLLQRTGTPQAGNRGEAIGPRPDLARAVAVLQRELAASD